MNTEGIREVNIEKDESGRIQSVRLVFGPHYFVELHNKGQSGVDFVLGATHHGFCADASEINGELEQIIYEIRDKHTDKLVD